jgi:hypothetical protein
MSTVIGLAVATILTTYIAAHTLSNQAFAQPLFPTGPFPTSTNQPIFTSGQPHVAHIGQVLGGITTTIHNILGGSTTRDHGDHGDLLGCGNPWDPC